VAPYYQDDAVTIYHGDCREILPELPKVDLVLTDPPYGIGKWNHTGGNSLRAEEATAINEWDVAPDDDLLRLVVDHGEAAIVWGGNYLCGSLGAFRTPLVWDKGIRGMHFADGELAWTNLTYGTLRIFRYGIAASEVKGKRLHPTQKPLSLMSWAIQQARPLPRTVLDPFTGSGSVLVAAKSLDVSAIGIEIDERYCEIAAKRCAQEVLDFDGV
jgi:DNA modification methylase